MEWSNTNISILAGTFLSIAIALTLIFPYALSTDKLILINEGGVPPQSCLPNGGFILAQNLTDLCDVTIISPTTNQIIKYNGSQWVNVNQASFTNETTVCSNIGGGIIIVKDSVGGNCTVKSLFGGTGITITNSSNTITVTNTLPEATVCNNLVHDADPGGLYYHVYSNGTGGNCSFRDLHIPDSELCMNFTGSSNQIEVRMLCDWVGKNVGSVGEGIYSTNQYGCTAVYVNCLDFKKLLDGSGISLSSNATRITITNTSPESTSCNNLGTGTILCAGDNVNIKTLKAGTGLSISNTTNDVTYTNTGVTSLTCTNTEFTCSASTGDITLTGIWQKLCSATATSGDTSITCGSFTAKKHLIIYANWEVQTSTALYGLRFNSNSSAGYEYRTATNGGADATAGSQTQLAVLQINSNTGRPHYLTFNCINLSASEKSCFGDTQEETTGAGSASGKIEYNGKWANTSQQITSVNMIRISGTGTLTGVANITVWGFD